MTKNEGKVERGQELKVRLFVVVYLPFLQLIILRHQSGNREFEGNNNNDSYGNQNSSSNDY